MTVLQNPSQVLSTRKFLVAKDWAAAQQQVEELGLGVWVSIKSAWDSDPVYANVQLRTPVLLIGDQHVIFINGLYEDA